RRPPLVAPWLPENVPTTIFGPGGAGKALALDTPLPTPTGWTTMGEIQVGDLLLDDAGLPCRVLSTSPVFTDHECFAVAFDDGEVLVADADHQWVTYSLAERSRKGEEALARRRARRAEVRGALYQPWREPHGPTPRTPSVRTTQQIAGSLMIGNEHNHAVAMAEPLDLPEADLLIDPYVLGAWLGDGASADGRLYGVDEEVFAAVAGAGYVVTRHAVPLNRGVLGLRVQLRQLGLLGNKHVPAAYLRASATQRLALVQGLMDTDGTVDVRGGCEFTTTRQALAQGMVELLVSLGTRARITEGRAVLGGKDCGAKYRVHFSPPTRVFRVARKALRQKQTAPRWRHIVDAWAIAPVPVRCVMVDSPSHLYLAGRRMVPTHNTTVAAAVAVAVLTGADYLGWQPRWGQVMVLDWEADRSSWYSRMSAISRAAGTEPPRFLYRRCSAPLADDVERLAQVVADREVRLVIVDSMTGACGPREMGEEIHGPVNRLHDALRLVGSTSLIVDHVTKDEANGNGRSHATATPTGSIMKVNRVRSAWEVRGETEPVLPGA
ncbi:MAG: AAA family ATPase, partial [Acidimicrobiales bacterium]